MASKSNIDLMNHMSDMLLHLNILNTALFMRLSSIYIEDLLGETASSATELIFGQKRRSAVVEFFCNFDRQLNKNQQSESSDFWNTSRTPYAVFKLFESSAYVDALRR